MSSETFPLSGRFGPGIRGRARFLAGKKPHGWWLSSLFNLAAPGPEYDAFERYAGYYEHAFMSEARHPDAAGILNFCRTMGVHPAHLRCRTADPVAPIALVRAMMQVAQGGEYDPRDRLIAIAALDEEKGKANLFLSIRPKMFSIVARSTQAWRGGEMPKSHEMATCELSHLLGNLRDVFRGAYADSSLSLIHFTYLRDKVHDGICSDKNEIRRCEREMHRITRNLQKIGDALFGADRYTNAQQAVLDYYNKRRPRTDSEWGEIKAAFSNAREPLYPFAQHAQRKTVVYESAKILNFPAMQSVFVDLTRERIKTYAHIEALKGAIKLNQGSSEDLSAIINNPRTHVSLMDAYECIVLMDDADLDLVRDEVQIGVSVKTSWSGVPLHSVRGAGLAPDQRRSTML